MFTNCTFRIDVNNSQLGEKLDIGAIRPTNNLRGNAVQGIHDHNSITHHHHSSELASRRSPTNFEDDEPEDQDLIQDDERRSALGETEERRSATAGEEEDTRAAEESADNGRVCADAQQRPISQTHFVDPLNSCSQKMRDYIGTNDDSSMSEVDVDTTTLLFTESDIATPALQMNEADTSGIKQEDGQPTLFYNKSANKKQPPQIVVLEDHLPYCFPTKAQFHDFGWLMDYLRGHCEKYGAVVIKVESNWLELPPTPISEVTTKTLRDQVWRNVSSNGNKKINVSLTYKKQGAEVLIPQEPYKDVPDVWRLSGIPHTSTLAQWNTMSGKPEDTIPNLDPRGDVPFFELIEGGLKGVTYASDCDRKSPLKPSILHLMLTFTS